MPDKNDQPELSAEAERLEFSIVGDDGPGGAASLAVPVETPAPGRRVSKIAEDTAEEAQLLSEDATTAPQEPHQEPPHEPPQDAGAGAEAGASGRALNDPEEAEILQLLPEMREDAAPEEANSNSGPEGGAQKGVSESPQKSAQENAEERGEERGAEISKPLADAAGEAAEEPAAGQDRSDRDAASPAELVPVAPRQSRALAPREPAQNPASLTMAQLEPVLKGAAAGEPVRIETLSNQRLTLRVTASIWARPEIIAERRTGCHPIGPVVESAEAAEAALAPLADDELARGQGLQSLRTRLTDDPWAAMPGLQGDDFGPLLAETRSVVSRCPDCAGAGGFSCIDCEGVGRRDCESCAGAGQVQEGCKSCRRAAAGLDEGKVALDPKRAMNFVLSQISSGGAAGEPAERSVATAGEHVAGRRDCADCGGAGSMRVDCANCAGAGERRCPSCSGSGRVTCAPCAGTGFLTEIFSGRARYERSLHIALSTGDADEIAPTGAAEAIRGAWDALVENRAFTPRLVGFQSSGFAAQAVFEAEITVTRLRAMIGAKAPRLHLDFWAAGEQPMLLDPPKALDKLHRRAVDDARLRTREGRRQVAGALSDIACGRAALRAAARRERALPSGAFGPLASDAENARLLDLARASHGSVGWREEQQVWTIAALLGAPAGWLAAQGLSAPAGAAIRPIAAAFTPTEASAAPGIWETLGAVWSLLVATAPFATLWLLAGFSAAWIYQRATKRTLGFARARSATRLFLGRAPLLALGAALFGYGVGLTIGAPAPGRESQQTPPAIQAAAVTAKPKPPIPSKSPAKPPARQAKNEKQPAAAGSSLTASAFGGGDALAAFAAVKPVDWEWRSNGRIAAIEQIDGRAVLSVRCEARSLIFRLEAPNSAGWSGAPHVEIGWGTERARLQARGLNMRKDGSGALAPEWRASNPAIRALRRDRTLRVNWSVNGNEGRGAFRLVRSSDVLQQLRNNC